MSLVSPSRKRDCSWDKLRLHISQVTLVENFCKNVAKSKVAQFLSEWKSKEEELYLTSSPLFDSSKRARTGKEESQVNIFTMSMRSEILVILIQSRKDYTWVRGRLPIAFIYMQNEKQRNILKEIKEDSKPISCQACLEWLPSLVHTERLLLQQISSILFWIFPPREPQQKQR